jgi:hypothetical protein
MVLNPVLQRHPDDGWTLAVPIKVGARTRRVLLRLADAILPSSPRTGTTLEDVTQHAIVSLRYMPCALSSGACCMTEVRARRLWIEGDHHRLLH